MNQTEYEYCLSAAAGAVSHAQDVRAAYRKRSSKGNRQREDDIQMALNRLKRAMRPIRSEIARQRALDREPDAQFTAASQAIQAERRKLWKMKDRKKEARRGKRGTRR